MKKKVLMRLKKITAATVGAALCLSVFMTADFSFYSVGATSSSIEDKKNKIDQLEEKNKQLENSIANIKDDISQSEEKQNLYLEKLNVAKEQVDNYNNLLYDMEQDIASKQANIDALDLQIAAKEEEIKQKEQEIEVLNEENDKNLEQFGKMLRAMYVTENTDIFSVLAESSDIYDLLVSTKMLVNVYQQNERMMEEIKQGIEDLNAKKEKLELDKTDIETSRKKVIADKEALEKDKDELLVKQTEAEELSAEYGSLYNQYSQEITDFENKQQQLQQQIQYNESEIKAYQEQIDREIQAAQQGSDQVYQQGEWLWPLETYYTYITSYYGNRILYGRPNFHTGIDISGGSIYGHPIYASKAGKVIVAKYTYTPGYSYGKYVVVDHGDGYSTLYAHCSEVYVSVGQQVNQGDTLAAVGSTGNSTGPHLHFEVRVNNVTQQPFDYVKIPGT